MTLVYAYAALHLACAPVLLYTYGKPQQRAMSVDIHHLAGVGPICVFAVPLTLNNVALDPLSKDLWPSAGLIDLGSDSLLTGTASKK